MSIFWPFVDVAMVNSFTIFCKRSEGQVIKLKEFRLAVPCGLIGVKDTRKRGRKSRQATYSKFKRHVSVATRLPATQYCALCSSKMCHTGVMAMFHMTKKLFCFVSQGITQWSPLFQNRFVKSKLVFF